MVKTYDFRNYFYIYVVYYDKIQQACHIYQNLSSLDFVFGKFEAGDRWPHNMTSDIYSNFFRQK